MPPFRDNTDKRNKKRAKSNKKGGDNDSVDERGNIRNLIDYDYTSESDGTYVTDYDTRDNNLISRDRPQRQAAKVANARISEYMKLLNKTEESGKVEKVEKTNKSGSRYIIYDTNNTINTNNKHSKNNSKIDYTKPLIEFKHKNRLPSKGHSSQSRRSSKFEYIIRNKRDNKKTSKLSKHKMKRNRQEVIELSDSDSDSYTTRNTIVEETHMPQRKRIKKDIINSETEKQNNSKQKKQSDNESDEDNDELEGSEDEYDFDDETEEEYEDDDDEEYDEDDDDDDEDDDESDEDDDDDDDEEEEDDDEDDDDYEKSSKNSKSKLTNNLGGILLSLGGGFNGR